MKSELIRQLRQDEGVRPCVYNDLCREPLGKVAAFSIGQPS
jgi:hypothetical protein